MRGRALMAAAALAALWIVATPRTLSAQPSFLLTPSLEVAVVSDSNLFMRATDRQEDVISRVRPAIDAEYRAATLTVSGRFTIDAERFAAHQSLTAVQARRQAALDFGYRPSPRLTLRATAGFSTTQTPGELNVTSGLTLTRAPARRLEASPLVSYRIGPITEGTLQYAVTEDRIEGGVRMLGHAATVTGERQVTPRDTARVDYIVRAFEFGPAQSWSSHILTFGWSHDLTRRTTIAIAGGPRVGDGRTAPDVSVSMNYRAPGAEVALGAARTQTTLIGLAGLANTDSVTAAVAYGDSTALRLRIAPAVMQTERAGARARVYRLTLGASYPLGQALTAEAGYDVTVQRGDLYSAKTDAVITRHVMVVSLAAARPRVQP